MASTPVKPEDLVLPSVAAIKPYEPGKPIEEVQRELGIGEPVKLASNENPIGPSPRALRAIEAALPQLNRYPDGSSYEMKRKIAAQLGVTPDQVFPGCGGAEILNLIAFLFLRPGLNAVIAEHSFVIYELAIAAAGGAAKAVPLRKDYRFDLDAMAAAIDADTRVVFLGNPNNPTGTIYRRAEWKRFLGKVPQRVVIVADEAYFEFVRDPEYPDSMEDHDGRRFLITMRTFSKIFGLAGLRVGYVVARPDIVRLLNNVRQPFNVNSLAQVAVIAGIDDQDHIRRTIENNRSGMAFLEREFARLEIEFLPSQANFILVERRRRARDSRSAVAQGSDRAADERLRIAAPRENQRWPRRGESAARCGARRSDRKRRAQLTHEVDDPAFSADDRMWRRTDRRLARPVRAPRRAGRRNCRAGPHAREPRCRTRSRDSRSGDAGPCPKRLAMPTWPSSPFRCARFPRRSPRWLRIWRATQS